MKKKKLNIFTYGETPLTTWDLILKKINIKKKDVLIELGCGRGRLSFWSCYFIKCKIISFEQIYSFCKIANFFKKFFKLKNINFFHANFFHANLSIATVIYFYSIDFHDDDILKMANVFKKLNSSTQIITISFPLTEYLKNDFYVKKSFEVKFPWGKSMAYVQVPVNKDL